MRGKAKISLTMFDLLKGTVIFLVLLLHSFMHVEPCLTIARSIPGRIVLSAAMPCLFMVSGYWLGKRKLTAGLKTSAVFLLKPYLIAGGLIVGISFVHRLLIGELAQWRDEFLSSFLLVGAEDGGRMGALWFVFALFLAWCLYYLVINIPQEKGQIAVCCLCALAGIFLMPFKLPFQICQGLLGFFYVYAGYQMKRRKLLQKQISPGILIVLAVLWAAGALFGRLNLGLSEVKNGLLSVPGFLCGGFLIIRLFLCLNVCQGKLADWIRKAGRYSLWILCIHSVEANVFPWKLMWRYFPRETVFGAALHLVLRCVLIGVVCHLMILWKRRASGKEKAVS